ncbi:hypothetical protein FNH09_45820 [Streptomyces adustus]|uniref:DUF2637 domain-containing protein n=1 Tax=Streptomyces adustus TaxID=1609272 RepID=A0A5N8VSP1_9ACTN|nr:hypothetical protein [Streptomyces adustus]
MTARTPRAKRPTTRKTAAAPPAAPVTDQAGPDTMLDTDTRDRVADIIDAAREQAAAARDDADRILTEARDRAAVILTEARAQVADLAGQAAADHDTARAQLAELRRVTETDLAETGALIERRRTEAGQIVARAHEHAQQLAVAAQAEVDQAHARAAQLAETAAAVYDARRTEAETLYADAVAAADTRRRDADQAVTAAYTEAEQARAELREQLREMGEAFDQEAAGKRAALDTDLARLRAACDEQRSRLQREAATVTDRLRETAEKEAARIVGDAKRKADALAERAQADEARARRLLDELKDAKRESSRWHGWHRRIAGAGWRTAPWIALLAGIGLAASGEYELAHMVGIHPYVAPLLPVSIDVYCVTAFRTRRDIPAALTLMASANVIYHLSEQAHLVPEGQAAPWWLTTFVVLIFVAVIWRVHSLMHDTGTDGHGGTDSGGTDGRTGTAARTDRTVPARTGPSATHSYAPPAGTAAVCTGSGTVGTQPVHGAPHTAALATANAGVTSANNGRTSGVQAAPSGAARTSTPGPVRTSAAGHGGGTRTSTVTARTAPAATAPAGRTGTATAPRTDDELLPLVRQLPRETDGYVNISRARTELSVNQPRAIRLLKEAGLLRPEDADKHLR